MKLDKTDQKAALSHIQEMPVRDIKKFVKLAKAQGVDMAMRATPNLPNQKDFMELDSGLKKLIKKMKQLSLEGIELSDFPEETQDLFSILMKIADKNHSSYHSKNEDRELGSYQ